MDIEHPPDLDVGSALDLMVFELEARQDVLVRHEDHLVEFFGA